MEAAYVEKLIEQQRAAVVFRLEGPVLPPPLLVIAGRVGQDQHACASRGASSGQGRRPETHPLDDLLAAGGGRADRGVARNTKQAMGTPVAAEALTWTGTFHAIGPRLLREHALSIGLRPDFSIHDREDSADLMNLSRHGLGPSKTESRFPTKGTCLAIYSRAVNAEDPLAVVLRDRFPWCAGWEAQLMSLFGAYVAAKEAQNVLDYADLLLAWAQMMADPVFTAHLGAAWDHVLIDEYQDINRLQARILMALKPEGAA